MLKETETHSLMLCIHAFIVLRYFLQQKETNMFGLIWCTELNIFVTSDTTVTVTICGTILVALAVANRSS